jgi:hypothetical protein
MRVMALIEALLEKVLLGLGLEFWLVKRLSLL